MGRMGFGFVNRVTVTQGSAQSHNDSYCISHLVEFLLVNLILLIAVMFSNISRC